MVKTYLSALLMIVLSVVGINAQITTEPTPLQEDSENVVIYFHADQGNGALKGLNASTALYAHTGVDLSDGKTWQLAPTWGDNAAKYKLEYVSENLWKLPIGDIRTYYGVSASVNVTRLCFVFRTADCSKQTADLFVDVKDAGLQISLTSNLGGTMVTPSTTEVTFKVGVTHNADIRLTVNGEEIGAASNATTLTADYTFAKPANYAVKATATANGETVSTEATYVYASQSSEAPYPGGTPKMGPVKNADGSVTFCLGAPQKTSVILVGAWNDYQISDDYVMNYTDVNGMRYFWTTVKGLDNSKQYGYYFLVDGQQSVGDPYARLVLDPWNDKYLSTDVYPDLPAYPYDKVPVELPLAIYQGNINDYNWKIDNFKGVAPSDLIIYELLFRDFTGTEGKAEGNGTVRKAIEKIPYLKELGVNAVELLPIMEFNGNISWGYNPNFYFAPDKAYGTPDDYKEFIDICHQYGMAVILDMVFNQSDGLHPWYQMYPVGQNPFYNMDAPHAYSVLNDWNQGYPMVQEQWVDVLRYWMEEYKFDGFRFDLVKGLGDNDSYANSGDAATNTYNASRVARMRELQKVVESVNPNAYFINENLAEAKEENEMAETGQLNWSNINNQGCQFAMGYQSGSGLEGFYAPNYSRTWGSTVSYLESHDEERLAYKQNTNGASGVKGQIVPSMHRLGSAAAQMILSPGAHMIWQFSELGNYDTTKDANGGNNTDPKTVRWNSLMGNANRMGLHDSYKELNAIRNNNPELFAEDATFSSTCTSNDWTKGRVMTSIKGDKELYTVINPNITGSISVVIPFKNSDNAAYNVLSKSYNSEPSYSASAKSVTVPANCYVVIGSSNVAAVEEVAVENTEAALMAYATDGRITVDYCEGVASVISADGRVAARLSAGESVAVAPGIYIVSNGSKSMKLIVK